MRLLPGLALAALLSGYATIVLGGYVSAIGAGLACPDWPTCQGALLPDLTDPLVATEYSHRLAAFLVGLFTLATLVWVGLRHRHNRPLVGAALAASLLLVTQIALGMMAVTSGLASIVVTAHLGIATGFIIAMTVTTVFAVRASGAVTLREEPESERGSAVTKEV